VNPVVAGATFLAAGVEWVEALTNRPRGRDRARLAAAFTGTIAAVIVLAALIAVFGLVILAMVISLSGPPGRGRPNSRFILAAPWTSSISKTSS